MNIDWVFWVTLVAFVLALPVVLFASYWSSIPQQRLASFIGGILGELAGGYFVWLYGDSLQKADGISIFVSAFIICSLIGLTGSLFLRFIMNIVKKPSNRSVAAHNGAH